MYIPLAVTFIDFLKSSEIIKKLGKKLNLTVAKRKHHNDKGVFGHENFF